MEQTVPGWRVADGALRRSFKTDGWPTTLMFVNAMGLAAEGADHHPDLEVSWGRVKVALSTHSAKAITEKDYALARRIDEIAAWHAAIKAE